MSSEMQPIDVSPFARTYALDAGPRVRLHLARRSDHPGVAALLGRCRLPVDDLGVSRLLTFEPGRRGAEAIMIAAAAVFVSPLGYLAIPVLEAATRNAAMALF